MILSEHGVLSNPYDILRLIDLIVGIACFIWLIGGLIKQRHTWNTKTRDFWYSRMMWALVQCAFCIETLGDGNYMATTLVLVTIAGLVTFKGLNKKGPWGYTG